LCIHNIRNNKPLPVYGKGENIRDWLYVVDHARGIDIVFHQGKEGETYNIGGFNEWKNIDIVRLLCKKMDEKLGRDAGSSEKLITYVKDRAGHDLRYAIDARKDPKGIQAGNQVCNSRKVFQKPLTGIWKMKNGSIM
jgi:dTDP-glucose 4,6-dehydratase